MSWRKLMAQAQVGAARATIDLADRLGRAASAPDPQTAARELVSAAGAGVRVSVRLAAYHLIRRATGEEPIPTAPSDEGGKVVDLNVAWRQAQRAKERWEP